MRNLSPCLPVMISLRIIFMHSSLKELRGSSATLVRRLSPRSTMRGDGTAKDFGRLSNLEFVILRSMNGIPGMNQRLSFGESGNLPIFVDNENANTVTNLTEFDLWICWSVNC